MQTKNAREELISVAQEVAGLGFDGAMDLCASIYTSVQAIDEDIENQARERYIKLAQTMSKAEAMAILGLDGTPTAEDVSKAYRDMAFRNHPDRGGDHTTIVKINVARDVLLNGMADAQGEPGDDEEAQAQKFVDENFTALKKRGWWVPDHNLLLNQTMMGTCNLWVFTVLPMFPQKKAYSERHKGIVLHPSWRPYDRKAQAFDMTLDKVKRAYVASKSMPTVQETVREEIRWIETHFQIRVPDGIQAKLVKDAVPTAVRRWGVDTLRIKDRVYPLDGSKPFDLSAWGF